MLKPSRKLLLKTENADVGRLSAAPADKKGSMKLPNDRFCAEPGMSDGTLFIRPTKRIDPCRSAKRSASRQEGLNETA
jgi:hypothetical protein